MTRGNDLDRALAAWFGSEAAAPAPAEPLARILEATRGRRPRPALVAAIGSAWIGNASANRVSRGTSPKPALIAGVVVLLLLALAAAALLVGSRSLVPPAPPLRHAYTDTLTSAPDLPFAMAASVVVPLLDGRVLLVGNGDGHEGRDTSARAAVYEPATGSATPTGPLISPDARVSSGVRLKDGRVLILGDTGVQIFDPTTVQFASVGPVVTTRSGANMAVLLDGRVLIAGGKSPGGNAGVDPALRSAELFDPNSRTFSATGPIGTQTGGGPMVTLPDGRVFMATDPAAEIYDPATGTFGLVSTTSPGGGGHPVVLPDGRVVAFGSTGLYSGGSITVWDLSSNTASLGLLPEPLTGATRLDDGRILVIGMCRGRQTGWTGLYDPASGVTNPGPPTNACRPTSIRLADGRVLIVGGTVTGDVTAVPTVQIFE